MLPAYNFQPGHIGLNISTGSILGSHEAPRVKFPLPTPRNPPRKSFILAPPPSTSRGKWSPISTINEVAMGKIVTLNID